MRHAQEAVRIPLPVGWRRHSPFNGSIDFRVPTGWADEHFGPPHEDHPDGVGLGHESHWALRFACGLECVLRLLRQSDPQGQTETLDIVLPTAEIDHVLRHLDIPDEWLLWRLDRADIAPGERARLFKDERSWEVWRQDDNGNAFLMQYADSERDARCVAETFERRAHKQIYWVAKSKASEG